MSWVWGGFALLTALMWGAAYSRARRVMRGLSLLRDTQPPLPPSWPRLSVLVAACNEEQAVESAVGSLLALQYPNLQVVVVDDRSSDRTGEILDRLAAKDPRLKVIHLTELPAGWLGKVHALHLGLQASDGDWVLLTDADVHFSVDALRLAVALAELRQLDHLALVPQVTADHPVLRAMQVWFALHLFVLTRVDMVHDPASPAFLGVGAFNLVRRDMMRRIGGMEALRMEVLDDMGIGYLVKRAGGRSDACLGHGLVHLRWYNGVGDMILGAEKNGFAAFAEYSHLRLLAVAVGVLSMDVLGPLAWVSAPWPWLRVFCLVLALVPFAGAIWTVRRRTGNPLWVGLLFPVAAVLVLVAALRSGVLITARGGVSWRGTFYALPDLRAGRVVKMS